MDQNSARSGRNHLNFDPWMGTLVIQVDLTLCSAGRQGSSPAEYKTLQEDSSNFLPFPLYKLHNQWPAQETETCI